MKEHKEDKTSRDIQPNITEYSGFLQHNINTCTHILLHIIDA